MLMVFSLILFSNRDDFRRGMATTSSAKATKFLTGGYKKKVFFWELIELFRRLAISGWVRGCAQLAC